MDKTIHHTIQLQAQGERMKNCFFNFSLSFRSAFDFLHIPFFVCSCQEESILSSMMYYFYCIENNKEAGKNEAHRAVEQMSP